MAARRTPNVRVPIEWRFWAKVERGGDDDCWTWLGARLPKGYGVLSSGGDRGRLLQAHRFSYEMHHGASPAGKCVLHSCDHPWCVNPRHLRVGSEADNSREMVERGRQRRGDNHQTAKLTSAQVLAIRERWANRPIVNVRTNRNGPHSVGAIARDYGINEATVRDIVHRRIWKHI